MYWIPRNLTIGSRTLNTNDNKGFMKARSRRVGLPAIRNIGISVRDAVRKILSSGKTRLKTKLLKLELGIETRLTLKITTLSFPRRNLEIAIPVLSYNVRRNEPHVRRRSFPRPSSVMKLLENNRADIMVRVES